MVCRSNIESLNLTNASASVEQQRVALVQAIYDEGVITAQLDTTRTALVNVLNISTLVAALRNAQAQIDQLQNLTTPLINEVDGVKETVRIRWAHRRSPLPRTATLGGARRATAAPRAPCTCSSRRWRVVTL
jgi:hypothetical protein